MNYRLNVKSIFMIIIILIFLTIGIIYYHSVINHPISVKDNEFVITVNKGDNLNKVLQNMKNKDEIKSLFIIKSYIKKNNINTNIKSGKYKFNSKVTLKEFIDKLNKGEAINLIRVTIPEGYDVNKIATLLGEKGIINKSEFINACQKYDILPYVKNKNNRRYLLEGYLFPDTYDLTKGQKPKEIIDIMVNRFNQIINDIKVKYNINDSEIDRIITVASIVEKEAEVDEERGKVASVFYNRIKKDMKMESCATVLYALGEHREKLYYKDLKVKSPYNTYIAKGLTPGPICNPGLSSIKATITPDKTNYLYFVSYNNGTHFFTNNYSEFLKVKKITQGN